MVSSSVSSSYSSWQDNSASNRYESGSSSGKDLESRPLKPASQLTPPLLEKFHTLTSKDAFDLKDVSEASRLSRLIAYEMFPKDSPVLSLLNKLSSQAAVLQQVSILPSQLSFAKHMLLNPLQASYKACATSIKEVSVFLPASLSANSAISASDLLKFMSTLNVSVLSQVVKLSPPLLLSDTHLFGVFYTLGRKLSSATSFNEMFREFSQFELLLKLSTPQGSLISSDSETHFRFLLSSLQHVPSPNAYSALFEEFQRSCLLSSEVLLVSRVSALPSELSFLASFPLSSSTNKMFSSTLSDPGCLALCTESLTSALPGSCRTVPAPFSFTENSNLYPIQYQDLSSTLQTALKLWIKAPKKSLYSDFVKAYAASSTL